MKTSRIANAVGYIDDDLITAAAESKKKTKHNSWLRWGSLAACFAVIIIAAATFLPSLLGGDGGTTGKYKDFIQTGESAVIWPWEYQTVYEKYTELKIDGVEYLGRGREVSASLVGEIIGKHTVVGYDEIVDGKKYTESFEIYQLKYADKSQFVAVKMDDKYYVFKNDEYAPPSTLGELFDSVDLPKVIELNRFSENGDGPDKKHYALNDDNYVWEVLSGCRHAEFVEDEKWTVYEREYLSFTVTSETLGVYRVAMYVTADGYLWTNAFGYQYLFNIGEDVAGKIIKYAKENSAKAEYEPYRNAIAGKVVEIADGYILIDDTMLCKNPLDGATYKVLLNDLRISRYVDNEIVKVGDTVQIIFEGEIDDANTIDTAISASEVILSGGDVLIPE